MTSAATPGHLATLARLLAQDAGAVGLSLRHLQVLGWICTFPDGTPAHVGTVARHVGVHQSSVSRAIAALVSHQLVERLSATSAGYRATADGRRIDQVMQAIYAPPATSKGRRKAA